MKYLESVFATSYNYFANLEFFTEECDCLVAKAVLYIAKI